MPPMRSAHWFNSVNECVFIQMKRRHSKVKDFFLELFY